MKHELTARRIRQAMAEKSITARELAKRSGIRESSVSHYVNGTHAPSNLSAGSMAKVLGVSPVWLMGFDVPMKEPSKEEKYYIDEKAREIAEFLYSNPQYNVLFDATRNVKPEDLEIVKALLDKFKG